MDPSCQACYQLGAHALAGQGGLLGVRGFHGLDRDRGRAAGAALLQPRAEPCRTQPADPVGGLVAGHEDQRCLLGIVERCFQRGEVVQHRGTQPVDRPHSVKDQVRAGRSQHVQVDRDLAATTYLLQVCTHPGLVSDDPGILGVGLAVTTVGRGGVMDHPSRDVEHLLTVVGEQPDQQGRTTGTEVSSPHHLLPISSLQHCRDQPQQRALIEPPRRFQRLRTLGRLESCQETPAGGIRLS